MAAAMPTISELYEQLITGWHDRDAEAFAQPFAYDAVVVGFPPGKSELEPARNAHQGWLPKAS
jgi:uncharacterized protein (TIGR02246 family)